jgi:membrane protein insertase Oxa1/YidC/SpoIIIJ
MIEALFAVFVAPLLQLYDLLFHLPSERVGVGGRILLFSLLLNLLLLPLYRQMEKQSRAAAALRRRVAADVDRIKRHFRGRERYFYVRAVHRQHGYRPLAQLFGSADLFLQILVFATVYRYLAHSPSLAGASFGPLQDLSRPDGLLGGVNLLPLLMTAINAAAIFAYGEERGRRLQALALAALFLFLLYGSPAGLVLYWTANNLVSLLRTLALDALAGQPGGRLARRFADLRRQE